jgi:trehalose 2-sulfotransferase
MRPNPPESSYIVWHTQRTGSTLLCTTLEATGIAGYPNEWPEGRLNDSAKSVQSIRYALWSEQTTPNGVLGVKWSYYQPSIQSFFRAFSGEQPVGNAAWREAWESVFPNCRHIVMTRQNKIQLAVSWWKSISGAPGHLSRDGSPLPWQDNVPPVPADLVHAYNFDAIKALVLEAVQREAGIQDLLTHLGASPFSITYEDFVADYEQTVLDVLVYLGLDGIGCDIPPPLLSRTSDHVNDDWVKRFLSDLISEDG